METGFAMSVAACCAWDYSCIDETDQRKRELITSTARTASARGISGW
jgi:hypothetical protein